MADKPQLHASDLKTLSMCPVRYEFRRLKGIIAPPGVAAVVGRATHRSIECNMREKIEKGVLLDEGAVTDIAAKSLVEEWAKGVMLDEDEQAAGEKKARGAAIDKSARLSRLHHRALAPTIQPKHVERPWLLTLKGYPMDLTGTIDLQEPDAIRDTKTAGKSPPQDAAHDSEQLTVYALAAKVLDGAIPSELHLDHLVDTKEPKVVTLSTVRSQGDLDQLLRRIEAAIKLIESGCFMPCDPGSWWCSPKWCGYHHMCPYVRHPVSVAT